MEDQNPNNTPWWTNTQNYYNHIKQLWDDIRRARLTINEGDMQLAKKSFEDWYEAQKILIDFLAPYIEKDVLKMIDENIASISKETSGIQFITLDVSPDVWVTIKSKLQENERLLSLQQAKKGLYLKESRHLSMRDYAA